MGINKTMKSVKSDVPGHPDENLSKSNALWGFRAVLPRGRGSVTYQNQLGS